MANPRETDLIPELDASFYDDVDGEESTQDHDFDAWWAERVAQRPTTTILGVRVPIPSQVPAEIMLQPDKALKLDSERDAAEIVRLLGLILDVAGVDGPATVEQLIDAGLGSEQLVIIFVWALLNGARPPGKSPVSFARVAALVEGQSGKAATPPNRAARRAASRTAAGSKKTTGTRAVGRR